MSFKKIFTRRFFVYFIPSFLITIIVISLISSVSAPTVIAKEAEPIKKPESVYYMPDTLLFCGEKVPLQYFDVVESLDRELLINTYWQSQTILLMKRGNRFLPIIDSIMARYKIPRDLRYIAIIESGLSNVASPAGAKGYWQIMEVTGKEFGLTVNSEVDERCNIELSTIVACKYLKRAYDKFQNWTLVAASYNMGMAGLQKKMDEQKQQSYYDLDLNAETARYVYRILAMKLIFENPEKYFFNVPTKRLYPEIPTKTIVVDYTIPSLNDFAIEHETNLKVLEILNPWLMGKSLTNVNKKEYKIKIPRSRIIDSAIVEAHFR